MLSPAKNRPRSLGGHACAPARYPSDAAEKPLFLVLYTVLTAKKTARMNTHSHCQPLCTSPNPPPSSLN
ncbi:hypothetical protein EVAR_85091_1 [Eumeta japonica]|uniref:Uncharacterized protein n=1 Tax=Eumeta variegata TaxID=151549 RepID=A0A4C1XPI1_EUMVA|nr:hypothetical protein EVAR_85091_1 [Eumeta japonica]